MRIVMVIPTYWQRARSEGWKLGDAVYDHPTPIDEEGTLGRTLESIKILNNKNFKLVIPVCPTSDEIAEEASRKTKEIVEKANLSVESYIFTPKNLENIKQILKNEGLNEELDLLNIKGYSNVRNICLYVGQILGADSVILIDDDEVFEKPDFVDMSVEFIGKRKFGSIIYGVAGYYLNKKDEYYDDVEMQAWMTYWDRFGSKAKAFDKIISSGPRIKITPFAFGGLMVIHKNMFRIVPFDPKVTRGEDIDYLINAKMYGFDFFLDNKLNIKHLPPPKHHPIWKRTREDIYRFLYEKSKIDNQVEHSNMRRISAEDFMPYPGDFLTDDLEDKIFKTNILLALDYLAEGKIDDCRGAIENVYLSKYEAIPKFDTFEAYREAQKMWIKVIDLTGIHRTIIRNEMELNNLTRQKAAQEIDKIVTVDRLEIKKSLEEISFFHTFDSRELERIIDIVSTKRYRENQVLFRQGDVNEAFYIVLKGCIRISKRDESNEEVILGHVATQGLLGETTLVNDHHYVDAIAEEYTEVLEMKQSELERMIQENPILGNKFLLMLIDKLNFKLSATNELASKYFLKDEHIRDSND